MLYKAFVCVRKYSSCVLEHIEKNIVFPIEGYLI